jgi:hypothetical protein
MEHLGHTYDTAAELATEPTAEDIADMDRLFENSFDHALSEIIASAEVYFGDRTFTYAHKSGTYSGTAAQVLDACPHAQTIAGQGGFEAFSSWITAYETTVLEDPQEEDKGKLDADDSESSLDGNKVIEPEIIATKTESIQPAAVRTPSSVAQPKQITVAVPAAPTLPLTNPAILKDDVGYRNIETHNLQPLSSSVTSPETISTKEPTSSANLPLPEVVTTKPLYPSAHEAPVQSVKSEIEIEPIKPETSEFQDTLPLQPDKSVEAAALEETIFLVSPAKEQYKDSNPARALDQELFAIDVLAPTPDVPTGLEPRDETPSYEPVEPEQYNNTGIVLPTGEQLIETYLMDAKELATPSVPENLKPITPSKNEDILDVTHTEFIPELLDYQEIALSVSTEGSETTIFNKALGAESEPMYSLQPIRERVIAYQDLPAEIAFALLESVVRTKEDIIDTNEHETEDLRTDLQADPSYDELVFRLTRLRIEIAYAKPTPSTLFEQLPESLQVQLFELLVELGYNNPHETMSSLLRRQDLAYVISFILHLVSILERETIPSSNPARNIVNVVSVVAASELPHIHSRLGRFVIRGLAITRDAISCPYPHAQVAA